jgi:hypothetical protein
MWVFHIPDQPAPIDWCIRTRFSGFFKVFPAAVAALAG